MQSEMTYIGIRQATMAQWVALRPLFEVCAGGKGYKRGGGGEGTHGGVKRQRRNSFRQPWQECCGRLRVGGARERTACSRNQKVEGGRIGKSACRGGYRRRPGAIMILCVRRRFWVGDGGRPGGRMNLCGSYGGDCSSGEGRVEYITTSGRV